MELRQLEYFVAVSKTLHFTKAAETLHIAQPKLIQQIKNLEDEIGTPLFDRTGKKTSLTEAGKILLTHSQRIFHEMEQAQNAMNDLNGLQRGKLTVGTLLTCINYLLPPAILEFKRLYPNIELQVFGLRSKSILTGILENELDLGIGFLPVENKELETISLFTEELSLAVPLHHPLAYVNEIDMKKLDNVQMTLLPQDYFLRTLIDTYGKEAGITIQPTLEMSTMDSLIQMVIEGVGATILPVPYLDALQTNQLVKVKLRHPSPKRDIGFIYRKDKFMCTATKSFIAQITETSHILA